MEMSSFNGLGVVWHRVQWHDDYDWLVPHIRGSLTYLDILVQPMIITSGRPFLLR